MKEIGPQDKVAERTRDRLVLVQELVREAGAELTRIRQSTAALEAQDTIAWERTQRWAHNIAARAQALNLGVLASCARELERFSGAMVAGGPQGKAVTLQSAAIAIEATDLELRALSKTETLA